MLSNAYIQQFAFNDEYFSGPQSKGTFLIFPNGNASAPLPNPVGISVRLGDERLDLNAWQVDHHQVQLDPSGLRLVRHFRATSPKGFTIEVRATRTLSNDDVHLMEQTYAVRFVNYSGVASLLALLGDNESAVNWHVLQTIIDDQRAGLLLQQAQADLQVSIACTHTILKNGSPAQERPIKIDKKRVLGFSNMQDVVPGDEFVLTKRIAIIDSLRADKATLLDSAMQKVL